MYKIVLNKKNIIISDVKKMWGLGTPDDLENFKNNFFKKE